MPVEISANQQLPLVIFSTPNGVFYEDRFVGGQPSSGPIQVTTTPADWVSGVYLPNNAGFGIIWDTPTGLMEQDYNFSRQQISPAHSISTPPPPAPLAFTSDANGASIIIGDGGTATLSQISNGAGGTDLVIHRTNPQGGAAHSFDDGFVLADAPSNTTIDLATASPMANGDYVTAFVLNSGGELKIDYAIPRSDGAISLGTLVDYLSSSTRPVERVDDLTVGGLPNGGFVAAWTAVRPDGAGDDLEVREVDPNGATIAFSTTVSAAHTAPHIQANPDGTFNVWWSDNGATVSHLFTEQQPSLNQTNDIVLTPDQTFVAPDGPHVVTVNAQAPQSVTGNALGDLITANDFGSTIIGGAGNDTLVAGSRGGQLTGAAGADTFVFKGVPATAPEVTDFAPGVDHIDFSALLRGAGYTGADPIGDHYIKLIDNGHGGTWVYFDANPSSDPYGSFITTLDNVAPPQIQDSDFGFSATRPPPPPPPPPVSPPPPTSPPPPSGGQQITESDSSHTLVGGAGDDTITAVHGGDTMTGNGGADHFGFSQLPWNPSEITDFTHGVDKLDVSALLSASHYTGSDPIGDGYVKLIDDGHGDTWVYFDTDGHGTADQWGTFVATLDHVSASSLGDGDLITASIATSPPPPPTSPPPTSPPPPSAGVVLQGQSGGSNLAGGSGDDTLIGGTGPDTMTGNAGADHFTWQALPWNPGEITDFTHGADRIDLSGLLSKYGYAGSDPIADGYIKLIDDGHGDTWLYFDTDGHGTADQWGTFIGTIEHVSPGTLGLSDFIVH